ncbi:hypothetical protein G7Z17_g4282 [Cylindrodendrum hubeiense]|uniref:Uncharacterized protein n=1 Tax=Cylindrodendrum hubeiense TaxID=595255 RepID=A0A9P5LA30_9HYPO|nr:hypothetical protein G7Z17_g4282 [Cylindrodendrum hubeiense]
MPPPPRQDFYAYISVLDTCELNLPTSPSQEELAMSVHWWALRLIQSFEYASHPPTQPVDVANPLQILRMPGFHRAVGQIHKKVHEAQHGRNPNQPLAPGEATADPGAVGRKQRFAKHFFDELKNQVRGKPSDLPHEPPRK